MPVQDLTEHVAECSVSSHACDDIGTDDPPLTPELDDVSEKVNVDDMTHVSSIFMGGLQVLYIYK